jgi:hypothetical protein
LRAKCVALGDNLINHASSPSGLVAEPTVGRGEGSVTESSPEGRQ